MRCHELAMKVINNPIKKVNLNREKNLNKKTLKFKKNWKKLVRKYKYKLIELLLFKNFQDYSNIKFMIVTGQKI
jgi:hypothetical protein